ncbi:chemotaxis protein CheA [Anaerosporobacter faecicola]|uniref:chemotaxis protein CheA n=1 Tax=Anaerosporobacter faecicola TaxID=2718714 RepID=UPI00143B2534|nr:chemotaxis protein CheA [Anaerosporobacter faecicola]
MAEEFSTEGMLDMYLYENGQLLEQMEATTLEKKDDESFDEATINEFFRIMHTIKGSSAVMMYDNITELAHKLEDIFYYIRESHPKHVPHMEMVDYIFQVTDFITGEFEKIKNGNEPDGCPDELIEEIKAFLEKIKNNIEKAGEKVPEKKETDNVAQYYVAPVANVKSQFFLLHIYYKPDTQMANLRAYSTIFALKDIAEDLQYTPEDVVSNAESSDLILAEGFKMLLQAQASKEEVMKLVDTSSEISSIEIDEISGEDFLKGFAENEDNNEVIDLVSDVSVIQERAMAKQKEEDKNEEKKSPQPGDYVIKTKEAGKKKVLAKQSKENKEKHQQNFISVNVEKMDSLMDLIGEIVIAESVVLQNPDLKVPGLNLSNFQKAARQLTKFTSEMQDVIMSMRMMPLTNVFQKMNRIVFDTSRKLGKEIDLQIIGETTEVDKNIIEHISDPLMHLIRNSVDHGIEDSKEERIEKGKPEKGQVVLEAKNEGGKVFIIVRDDGKGMNPKKIFQKAQENGLISDKMVQSDLTDKEIYQFITYPGFSTKEQVTEVSGRGVGMDVVVKNIQEIGGRLDIESTMNEGSTFTLKIPLTLAIIEGVVMVVGETTFVVETSAVKEFLSIKETKFIKEPNGEEYVMVREECYPLLRMDERYHIKDAGQEPDKAIIIILEHEEKKVCVLVDRLIGEQEIVVKPIPTYIKRVDGISGCTQLGDGSLALILDVGGLV